MSFDDRVFIIAEAGVNHNGRLTLAKKLVDLAKDTGCDAVKFQTFCTESLVSRLASLAQYQKGNNGKGRYSNQADLLKKLELSPDEFKEIKRYCDGKRIVFLSTPFDLESADFVDSLGVPCFKISSGDLTNLPFLAHVARKGKPILLSTGMSDLDEVTAAVEAIFSAGNKEIILLHCVTEYPAPFRDINLTAMDTLSNRFQLPVGYSDHTAGIEIALAAAARGAKVIEKHFTLNKNLTGPDHRASLAPGELREMVRCIRNIETSLGDGIKRPAASEFANKRLVRKSIVTVTDISKGQCILPEHVAIKRPGYGIPPKDIENVVGRKARLNIRKDTVLSWKQFYAERS